MAQRLADKIRQERDRLTGQIADLDRTLTIITMFESAAGQTPGRGNGHAAAPPAAESRQAAAKRKGMTPAQRRAVSARMKKYWRARRAAGKAGNGRSARV